MAIRPNNALQATCEDARARARTLAMPGRSDLQPCSCCGYLTLQEPTHASYEICPICFWEDDPVQFSDPDFAGGANRVSLRQAQANFTEFGACKREVLPDVRLPGTTDARAPDWRGV